MSILRLFVALIGIAATSNSAGAAPPALPKIEHAVVIHFNYGSRDLTRLFELEEKLENAIVNAGVGEYDGNEIAVDGNDCALYMYGPDADRLFQVVRPVLEGSSLMGGAKAKLRYGPPQAGSKEKTIVINP